MAYGDRIGPPDLADRELDRGKDPANHVLVVMELGLEKPRTLWQMPWYQRVDGHIVKDQFSGYCRPQDCGRSTVPGRRLLDGLLRRKNRQANCPASRPKEAWQTPAISCRRTAGLFSAVDGKHGTTRMARYTTDPENFHPTGPDEVWVPPHPNTTSYGPCMLHPVADGRIFIRGHDAIYCYDLRAK